METNRRAAVIMYYLYAKSCKERLFVIIKPFAEESLVSLFLPLSVFILWATFLGFYRANLDDSKCHVV